LTGSRFVHLATHGFFEPPELAPRSLGASDASSYWTSPQGLSRLSPGLLSGIAFAGANQPPAVDRDDGILTAVEAQQLDLNGVELIVLSACETALGSEARGEGLIGLQRAFQVAGAETLVSSLWPVDDAATSVLMDEFYANLWSKKLSKIESLRQAQLAIMKRYDTQRRKLRNEDDPAGRRPAYFWAPFSLSGNWR
jgi:CHAT domain-containing protein